MDFLEGDQLSGLAISSFKYLTGVSIGREMRDNSRIQWHRCLHRAIRIIRQDSGQRGGTHLFQLLEGAGSLGLVHLAGVDGA